jgi:hypothetical protein
MQHEKFTPQDSLLLIQSMIDKAKNRFTENGFLYLLWGWVIFLCATGHFILLRFTQIKNSELIWYAWIPVAIFQIFYLSKKGKNQQIKTYSDNLVNFIWISYGITMLVIGVILTKLQAWQNMSAFCLLLYGMPTFLSGVVIQFKPLQIGGIACWALATLAVFIPPLYGLLLLGLGVQAAWIIPGYLLQKKYKSQNTITI